MTHLDVWQNLWSAYCDAFRENFGQHEVELSPVALETFALKIKAAVEESLRPEVAWSRANHREESLQRAIHALP